MRQVCDKIQPRLVKRMGYREDMARCRDYIAEHLQEELTPAELADPGSGTPSTISAMCFEVLTAWQWWNICGIGVCVRRPSQLLLGSSVTETAMDSGFDTVSGFTRAFTRKFGLAPSVYKKLKGANFVMKPEIKHFPTFTAVGYVLKPES